MNTKIVKRYGFDFREAIRNGFFEIPFLDEIVKMKGKNIVITNIELFDSLVYKITQKTLLIDSGEYEKIFNNYSKKVIVNHAENIDFNRFFLEKVMKLNKDIVFIFYDKNIDKNLKNFFKIKKYIITANDIKKFLSKYSINCDDIENFFRENDKDVYKTILAVLSNERNIPLLEFNEIISNILYNRNRKYVYELLVKNKPVISRVLNRLQECLFGLYKRAYLYAKAQELLCQLDIIKYKVKQEYLYSRIAFEFPLGEVYKKIEQTKSK